MPNKRQYYDYEYEEATATISSWAYRDAIRQVIDFIKPKPSFYPLIRIGPNEDGAYLLPKDFDGVTACFSPGVNNQKQFEDSLAADFGIKSFMCDFSSDIDKFKTALIPGMQTFRKSWLDLPGRADSIDLDSWVRESVADSENDLILQMDIEGAEFRNILGCSEATLQRFRIIVIEVHGVSHLNDASLAMKVLHPFFMKFEKHFVCVHAHPNNCCGESLLPGFGINLPRLVEFTFHRKDRQAQSLADFEPMVTIPHPDDITCNVITKPPIVLNEKWLDAPRPLAAKVKILEDEIAWLKSQSAQNSNRAMMNAIKYLAKSVASRPAQSISISQDDRLVDVADRRPFRLSGAYAGDSNGVVRDEGKPYFFHTKLDFNQSITIDLGATRTIARVEIRNRLDACYERAEMLFALFHNVPNFDSAVVQYIDTPESFLSGKNIELEVEVPIQTARYVTFFSPMLTALHFSRIRIFAVPPPLGD